MGWRCSGNLRIWGLPGKWIWPLQKGHVVCVLSTQLGLPGRRPVLRMLWPPRCGRLGGFLGEEEDFVKFCLLAWNLISCSLRTDRSCRKRATIDLHHLVEIHNHSQKTWLNLQLYLAASHPLRTVSLVSITAVNISDLPKPMAQRQFRIMVKEPGLATQLCHFLAVFLHHLVHILAPQCHARNSEQVSQV